MTRTEFEHALRVLREGRPTHSLYAVEDAKAALKPVARYYWRPSVVQLSGFILGAYFAPALLPEWPWFLTYFTGAIVGGLTAVAILRVPAIRAIMAPRGLQIDDVMRAHHVTS